MNPIKFKYKSKVNENWSMACVNVPTDLFKFQIEDFLRNDLKQLGLNAKYIEIEK